MIKRSPLKGLFPNKYNGLGGHVEKGESILEAAIREVKEESGLEPSGLWLCAVVAIDTGNKDTGIAMWVFRGEADGEPQSSLEGEIRWVPIADAVKLPMVEDIPTLLPKVLGMSPGDQPLWGLYTYDAAGSLAMRFDPPEATT